jgi:hypothetical protein
MSEKSVLEVVIIPIAVASIPIVWAFINWYVKRRQFSKLILREIEEISPLPEERTPDKNKWWKHHSNKRILHKEILEKPTDNRDFIFSIDADLIYYVTQLWSSKKSPDQWLYMIYKIEEYQKHKYGAILRSKQIG